MQKSAQKKWLGALVIPFTVCTLSWAPDGNPETPLWMREERMILEHLRFYGPSALPEVERVAASQSIDNDHAFLALLHVLSSDKFGEEIRLEVFQWLQSNSELRDRLSTQLALNAFLQSQPAQSSHATICKRVIGTL